MKSDSCGAAKGQPPYDLHMVPLTTWTALGPLPSPFILLYPSSFLVTLYYISLCLYYLQIRLLFLLFCGKISHVMSSDVDGLVMVAMVAAAASSPAYHATQ